MVLKAMVSCGTENCKAIAEPKMFDDFTPSSLLNLI
jgi:hypothetical protein